MRMYTVSPRRRAVASCGISGARLSGASGGPFLPQPGNDGGRKKEDEKHGKKKNSACSALSVLCVFRLSSSVFHRQRIYRDKSSFLAISLSMRSTYAASIVKLFSVRSGASNET